MVTGSDPGLEAETSWHNEGPTAAAVQTPDGDTVGRRVGDRIKRDRERQQQFTGRWGDQGKAGLTACPGLQWVGCPRGLCHVMVWVWALQSGPGFSSWPLLSDGPPRLG